MKICEKKHDLKAPRSSWPANSNDTKHGHTNVNASLSHVFESRAFEFIRGQMIFCWFSTCRAAPIAVQLEL
jgi:hypothetical protein